MSVVVLKFGSMSGVKYRPAAVKRLGKSGLEMMLTWSPGGPPAGLINAVLGGEGREGGVGGRALTSGATSTRCQGHRVKSQELAQLVPV